MVDITALPMMKWEYYESLKSRYKVQKVIDVDEEEVRRKIVVEESKRSPKLIEGEDSANALIRMFKSAGVT